MSDCSNNNRSELVALAIILIATSLVYLPSLTGEFLNWDDDRFITRNPHVDELSAENLAWAFGELRFESYQPLHMVSYMVDGSLFGPNPTAFRVHNLVLFLVALSLLYGLLRRFGLGAVAAAAGVLVFSLAPARVESVAWISCRKDVLALAFSLAAWHLHLAKSPSVRGRLTLRAAALVLFLGALLSKSSAFVVPAMMIAYDALCRDKTAKQAFLEALHLLVPALSVALFLPLLWTSSTLVRDPIGEGALGIIRLAGWSLWHYVSATLYPIDLSPLYAKPTAVALNAGAIRGYIALGVLAALAVFLWRRRARSPVFTRWLVSIVWFLLGIAPFLNLVPMYFLLADRYLLFPSLGVALAAASYLHQIRPRRLLILGATGLVLLSLATLSFRDARSWRSSEALWEKTTTRQPTSFYARLKLGETYRTNGKYLESSAQYHQAQIIRPLSPVALGGVFWGELLAEGKPRGLSDNEAQQMALYFVSIANDRPKLRAFGAQLRKRKLSRAAAIAASRVEKL